MAGTRLGLTNLCLLQAMPLKLYMVGIAMSSYAQPHIARGKALSPGMSDGFLTPITQSQQATFKSMQGCAGARILLIRPMRRRISRASAMDLLPLKNRETV